MTVKCGRPEKRSKPTPGAFLFQLLTILFLSTPVERVNLALRARSSQPLAERMNIFVLLTTIYDEPYAVVYAGCKSDKYIIFARLFPPGEMQDGEIGELRMNTMLGLFNQRGDYRFKTVEQDQGTKWFYEYWVGNVTVGDLIQKKFPVGTWTVESSSNFLKQIHIKVCRISSTAQHLAHSWLDSLYSKFVVLEHTSFETERCVGSIKHSKGEGGGLNLADTRQVERLIQNGWGLDTEKNQKSIAVSGGYSEREYREAKQMLESLPPLEEVVEETFSETNRVVLGRNVETQELTAVNTHFRATSVSQARPDTESEDDDYDNTDITRVMTMRKRNQGRSQTQRKKPTGKHQNLVQKPAAFLKRPIETKISNVPRPMRYRLPGKWL